MAIPPGEREAMRSRALRAVHDLYNWEAQVETLFGVYRQLLETGVRPGRSDA